MVAGVFAELARERPRRRFTDRHQRRRLRHEPALRPVAGHRAARHGPRGLLRPRLGRHGRREQEHDQDPRRRGEPARPGLLRLRLEEVGLADRVAPALRAAADPGAVPRAAARASSAATSSGCSTRSTCSAGRRPARRCCSTAGTRRTRSGMRCRGPVQEQILAKRIDVYAIDAGRIAREVGLAGRINIVLQTCFFAISGVLPRDEAIAKIKEAIAKTYGRRGAEVVERNQAAVDRALEGLHQIEVPDRVTATRELPPLVPAHAPEFVRTVTAEMMAGRGDDLPVSALPVDGTYPSGTTAYEKRNISELVAVWDPDLCIQCGNCSFVCPHSVIRSKYYDPSRLEGAPDGFRSAPLDAPGLPDSRYTLQVYVEDCTGCGLCVEACPVGGAGRPGPQGDQPRAARAAGRRRARQHRVLRDAAGERPVPGGLRHGARHPVPGAAVRVLRRLRGLRRDALPQAALAAVRRPADGRQRDRVLVDLRREPAHHAVDDRRRRPRPGLVELPVRGQRRVRARLPARRRRAHRTGAPAARRAARRGGRRAGGRHPGGPAAAGVGAARAARAGGRAEAAARRAGRPRRDRPASASWTTWSGAACGSSAATAGPTTSGPAASTTSWPAGAT